MGYETTSRIDQSLREGAARYIERCRLGDGGYFFARVPPSSAMDTFFAVKSLSLLGVKPDRPQETADFFLAQMKDGSLGGISSLFCAAEVLNELGQVTAEFRTYAQSGLRRLQNEAGGYGAYENIDVEIASELQSTYRATRTLVIVGAGLDGHKIGRFVSGFLNADGGYGSKNHSTLASTYYATGIRHLLRLHGSETAATKDYLRRREQGWQIQFIEDLYWLIESLANLGEKPAYPDRAIKFVVKCRRRGGGFSRATIMGIPTLEYTLYALSILKEAEASLEQ